MILKKNKVIQGCCLYCGSKNTVVFMDHYQGKELYYKDLPTCTSCSNDEVEVRKINNRRYKVVGKYD